jgi:hypothetical protein
MTPRLSRSITTTVIITITVARMPETAPLCIAEAGLGLMMKMMKTSSLMIGR